MSEPSPPPGPKATLYQELRKRLEAALAEGQTLALDDFGVADGSLRTLLPDVLEEIGGRGIVPDRGPVLEGYTVLGEIGRGGMSVVYLARDEKLGRRVALKVIQTPTTEDRARKRALREARALASLQHPNIVTVHDAKEAGSELVIVMEWVDGMTLSNLLRQLPPEPTAKDVDTMRKALDTNEDDSRFDSTATRSFVRMIRDIALAVDAAHAENLLHLDIKPSNVLVRRDGTALLIDFGVVREIDTNLTHTQTFAGTPVYASPEQLRRDDRSFGPHTDVYGLGITLYEALARTKPIPDDSLTSMVRRIEAGRVARLSSLTHVASDLENIVHMAIANHPADRYQTARELAEDLTAFLEGLPVRAHPEGALQRIRRWTRAEPWKAALLATLLILTPVLLGLGTYLVAQWPSIAAQQELERRTEARLQAQDAFFGYLLRQDLSDDSMRKIDEAMKLDPDNDNLVASTMTMLAAEHPEEALSRLAKLPEARRKSDGMRALLATIEDKNLYVPTDVARKLTHSREPTDLLIAALEQILLYRDSSDAECLDIADRALGILVLQEFQADPMSRALRAWVAAARREREILDAAGQALLQGWPDSPEVRSWYLFALNEFDPEEAAGVAIEMAGRPGISYAETSNIVWILGEAGRFDEALEILRQAPTRNAREREHRKGLLPLYLALAGHENEARALLGPQPEDASKAGSWLRTIQILDPDRCRKACRELLGKGEASAQSIERITRIAGELKDGDLFAEAVVQGYRLHPERVQFRRRMGIFYLRQRKFEEGVELLESLPVPAVDSDDFFHFLAYGFCGLRSWDRLLELCKAWERQSPEDAGPLDYFYGIAYARLGDREKAAEHLTKHLTESSAGRRRIEAYFEKMLLQVDPQSPPSVRDPGRALGGLEQLLRLRKVRASMRRKPWLAAICAEVYLANDDPRQAREFAEMARDATGAPDSIAPADLTDRIDDLLARTRRW